MTFIALLFVLILLSVVAWASYSLGFKNGKYEATSINNEHKPYYGPKID